MSFGFQPLQAQWSRHKPYNFVGAENKRNRNFGRSLSIRQYLDWPSIYFKELGKQSVYEKPYLDKSRPKMHSDPSVPTWDYPPFPDWIPPMDPEYLLLIFSPGYCSMWVWSPSDCGETTSGSANIWTGSAPRRGQGNQGLGTFAWKITPSDEGVQITNVRQGWTDVDFDIEVDEGLDTNIDICISATFAGHLLHIVEVPEYDFKYLSPDPPLMHPGWHGIPHGRGPEVAIKPLDVWSNPVYDCGCHTLTVNSCCLCEAATIGYTTQQMSVNDTQNLTVVGGTDSPKCYKWVITSGSGAITPPEGTSVTYTAPADNPGCLENPTIELQCGGVTLDSLEIAIDAYGALGPAWSSYDAACICIGWNNDPWPACISRTCDNRPGSGLDTRMWGTLHNCDGSINWYNACGGSTSGCCGSLCPACDAALATACANCNSTGPAACAAAMAPLGDRRTAPMIAAGCCPEQAL